MNMLQKLKQKLKSWVSRSSKKSSAVKLGAPLITRRKKINNYIKHKHYIFKLGSVGFFDKYDIKSKSNLVLLWAINIIVTGFAVKYCIENRNALSYGLAIMLILFYFEKIVEIIKKPIEKNEEEE